MIFERQFLRVADYKPGALVVNVSLRRGNKSGGGFDADNTLRIAAAQNRRGKCSGAAAHIEPISFSAGFSQSRNCAAIFRLQRPI